MNRLRPAALRLAATLLVLLLARPALADGDDAPRQRRFGNVVYTLPAGWQVRGGRTYENVRPSDWSDRGDDGGDDFYPDLYFLPGDPFSGGTDALKAWAADKLKSAAPLDDDQIVEVGDAWVDPHNITGPRLLIGTALIRQKPDENGEGRPEAALPFVALRAGGRADLLCAVLDPRHADKPHLDAALKAMGDLLEGAAFVSTGAKPLEPPATPGGYDGVYWGTWLRQGFGMDFMMTLDAVHERFTLFADGTFADGLAPGGPFAFDYAAATMTHTDSVGTYALGTDDDGKPALVLSYADGRTDHIAVDDDGDLRYGQAYLSRVGLPPDGWTFEGSRSYQYYVATGSAMAGNAGGASGGGTTTFHPDGTAASDGWHGFTMSGEVGDTRTSAAGYNEKPTAVGRYASRAARSPSPTPPARRRRGT